MSVGSKLGLRLFMEGIEIPVIGASISIAANAPAVASIQIIPTDKVFDILPRTVVHLFFYDYVMESVDYRTVAEQSGDRPATGWDSTLLDTFNDQYKLLFMGEVQGMSFNKDSGARSVVLQCADFSNYWDTTYQYNFQGSLLGGRRHAAFIGANANLFTSPLGHGVGTIAALLNGKSVNFPELKGLLAGLVRLLEAIGGSYRLYDSFKGANDFTSIAELRLKITQQITAAEKDCSTRKLFARKTFNMWMNRQMGSLGKLVTFRGLTRILQQFIFHEIYPCPVARYVPGVKNLTKPVTWKTRLDQDPRTRNLYNKLVGLRSVLESAKRNIADVPASTEKEGTFRYTLTAIKGVGAQGAVSGAWNDLWTAKKTSATLVWGGPPPIPGLSSGILKIDRAVRRAMKTVSQGGTISIRKLMQSHINAQAQIYVQDAIDAVDVLLRIKTAHSKKVFYDREDRVNNQILRPDLWFVPPPRCNVLFPEMYYQFGWSRNFLREVTRMELQTTNEILGDDMLFNGRYYAPNIADMRRGVRLSSQKFGRLIMNHELYTGIIPMFEKLSEANLFALKSRKVQYKGAKVPYAQRSVNFQYFKHRFASRGMQATGRFYPWFVPGFPALLIDRPMDVVNLAISGLPIAEQLKQLNITPETGVEITRAMMLQHLVPVQFLGSCVQLVHNVNQQGGVTQYAFGQARVHRESTEYLGVDKQTISKKIGTARKTTLIAATPTGAPQVKKRGPRGGIVLSVTDVTDQYTNAFLPIFRASNPSYKVRVGTRSNQSEVFTASTMPDVQRSGSEYFKAYKVTELFTRRARVKIDLPIEDAIRPPWIWDGWTNLKIGETYKQFFDCYSITDVEEYQLSNKDAPDILADTEIYDAVLAERNVLNQGTGLAQQSTELMSSPSGPGSMPTFHDPADPKFYGLLPDVSLNKVGSETTQSSVSADTKVSVLTLLAMEKERTIENAIDYLVRVYSFIRHSGLDINAFIRNYGWRNVATMVEILGSADFAINKAASEAKPRASANSFIGANLNFFVTPESEAEEAEKITGKEGFHSRAFSDESNLFGLVDSRIRNVLGLSRDKEKVAAKLDVRGPRRQAVRDYMEELNNSKGLLG